MAVAATFDFLTSDLFATVITVDNIFTELYFMFLFLLPAIGMIADKFSKFQDKSTPTDAESEPAKDEPYLEQIAIVLYISVSLFAISMHLSPWLESKLGTDISLDIIVLTILITVIANLFPKWLSKYSRTAFSIGMFMMFVFLAVIGASCDLAVLWHTSWQMILFVTIILLVHLSCILVGGKLIGASLVEILIASAANAGGPSISAPMAANFGKPQLVTPAILIGVLGYLIGTFLGLGVGLFLK